jgi:hypothetical protein
MMTIIPQDWQLGPDILGDSNDDTAFLRGMYQDAQGYCKLMTGWADAVDQGESLSDVFPVSASPTNRNAQSLRERIGFLQTEIIPTL